MEQTEQLYTSWAVEGSYFNRMIDCGNSKNHWVEIALGYLPLDVLDANKEALVFVASSECDAFRLAPQYREREVIVLSGRIFPTGAESEGDRSARYFIFAVLHEVAHAVLKHKSPRFDGLTVEENDAQETEANELAYHWFNQHVENSSNEWLLPVSKAEVEEAMEQSRKLRDELERVQKNWHESMRESGL